MLLGETLNSPVPSYHSPSNTPPQASVANKLAIPLGQDTSATRELRDRNRPIANKAFDPQRIFAYGAGIDARRGCCLIRATKLPTQRPIVSPCVVPIVAA